MRAIPTKDDLQRAGEVAREHGWIPGCDHDWKYLERQPGETYTGYCERCTKCGDIIQIVQ